MRNKLKNIFIKFSISEILMILINTLFYQICCIKFEKTISFILAMSISLVFDYILCIKYVFKDNLNKSKYRILKFGVLGIFGFLLKQGVIKIFYYKLTMPLVISKLLGNIFIIIFNYLTKCYIFFENYKININRIIHIYEKIYDKWKSFISMKYIKFIFKFFPQNFFVFLLFVISIYYTFIFIRDNDDMSLYNQVVSDSYIKLIEQTMEINFSNINVEKDVDRICLVFGTYGEENDSTLEINIYNEKNKSVYKDNISAKNINTGKGLCLNIPMIDKKKINEYTLKITPKNTNKNNYIFIYTNKKTKEPTLYLKRSHELVSFKYITMFISVLLFLGLNYYLNKKGNKISEKKYLLIMLCYFLAILILNPPLENPDEPSHLYSSYNLSQNWLDADEKTEIFVPKNIECLNYANIQNTDRVVNFEKVKACMKNSENQKTNLMFGVSNRITNSFLGHLPQAISIKIADTFSNSSLLIFYLARLGNFIIAFIILYKAIKMAPVGKKILLFIGLTPMFVQQITSLSYDAILNSLALLFIAYIIKLFYNTDKIKVKDIFIPIIFLLTMLTVKVVYVPLGILLLFIPKDKFKDTKQKLIYIISIIIFVLIGKYLIQDVFFVNNLPSDGVMERQINYILKNPLKLFPIAINTFKINGWYYMKSLVGYFCWFRFSLSDFTIIAWIICFILLILSTKNILNFDGKKINIIIKKIIYIISILISIGGIFASMYFCWSKYALNYVDGVQGRYFIPLLGFIALLFMPKKEKINFSRQTLYSFCNVILFQYLIYLITYFY